MSKESAPGQAGSDSSPEKDESPLEEFIGLIVPEPDLLDEETRTDPDSEPRVTGS